MSAANAGRSAWDHLTEWLSGDARQHYRRRAEAYGRDRSDHAGLHRILSGVKRDLRTTRPHLSLHAAAVASDGGALLVLGASGSGKSTLATDLGVARAGAIISDDTVWLDGFEVRGFGSPIALRRTNRHFEAARRLWYATQEDRLLVRPDDLGVAMERGAARLRAVVLPHFAPDARPSLTPASAAGAFLELLRAATGPFDPGRIDELASIAATIPTARIQYPTSAEALSMCDRFRAETGRFTPTAPRFLTSDDIGRADLPPHVRGVVFEHDAVLWSTVRPSIVQLAGWSDAGPLAASAREALTELGLAAP